jgi:mono/diheme cytochrome c family protein
MRQVSNGEWQLAGLKRLAWWAGYCLAPLTMILGSVLFLSGCGVPPKTRKPQMEVWDDMRRQEKFKPQQVNTMFSDGRASRRPPEGTIARGFLKADDVMTTGLQSPDLYAGKNPLTIDADLLKLGQARFNVYCTPCHDRAATGKGSVALKAPAFLPSNLHDERIKKASDGEIFNVITNGKRAMPAYKYQIASVKDRWAIVAYVRVLQRMSSGTIEDVPAEMRSTLTMSKSQTLLPPPPPPPAPPAPAGGQTGAPSGTASPAGAGK